MPPEKKRHRRQILLFVCKTAIAVLLLYFLLHKTRYEDFARNFRQIAWGWVIAASSLHIIGYLVSAHRWRILLAAQGVQAPFWELLKSYVISTLFNYILPGTVLGDIYRSYDTGVKSRKGAQAVSAVFVERVTGVAAMMFLASVGIVFLLTGPTRLSVTAFWNVQAAVATCTVMFLILFAILFVFFHPRIVKRIAARLDRPAPLLGKLRKVLLSLHAAATIYRSNPTPIYKNLFWATVLQLNVTLHWFFLGKAMGLPHLSFFSYMVIVPAVTLILMIPITPGGTGVREWTLVQLRTGLGFSGAGVEGAVLMGLLKWATDLLYVGIGFLMLWQRLFVAKRSASETVRENRSGPASEP